MRFATPIAERDLTALRARHEAREVELLRRFIERAVQVGVEVERALEVWGDKRSVAAAIERLTAIAAARRLNQTGARSSRPRDNRKGG